jgi:hypothetical protein
MPAGYWFMLFGLLSFAAMGVIHKLGDRYACNPLHIALFTMATSCVLSFLNAALSQRESLLSLNARVVLIALPFGAASGRRNVFVGVAGSIFICFGFFVLSQLGLALGAGGVLPAWLAGWLPNLIFGTAGLWLTAKVR